MKLLIFKPTRIDPRLMGMFQEFFAQVEEVSVREQALALLECDHWDMFVIDSETRADEALTLVRDIRQHGDTTPVIMLADRDSKDYRVSFLNAGADDCFTPYLDYEELLARMQAVHRRSKGHASNIIIHGDITLDVGAKRVFKSGYPVTLSAYEFSILVIFMNNVGKVFSKERIESQLYDLEKGVESNTVEVHICHLRKKLGRYLIKTIRGMGYLLDHPSMDNREDQPERDNSGVSVSNADP